MAVSNYVQWLLHVLFISQAFIVASRAATMSVLLPFYIYPDDLVTPNTSSKWQGLARVAAAVPTLKFEIIVSPPYGVGAPANSDYTRGMKVLTRQPNIRLWAYTPTGYGDCFGWFTGSTCPPTATSPFSEKSGDVAASIKGLMGNYANIISGVFLDEQGPQDPGTPSGANYNSFNPATITTVWSEYSSNIYSPAHSSPSPVTMVFGNNGFVQFNLIQFNTANPTKRVADVIVAENSATYFKSGSGANSIKGSLVNVPTTPAYQSGVLVNSLTASQTNVTAYKSEVTTLATLAKGWGAKYFSAVYQYNSFEESLFLAQANILNLL